MHTFEFFANICETILEAQSTYLLSASEACMPSVNRLAPPYRQRRERYLQVRRFVSNSMINLDRKRHAQERCHPICAKVGRWSQRCLVWRAPWCATSTNRGMRSVARGSQAASAEQQREIRKIEKLKNSYLADPWTLSLIQTGKKPKFMVVIENQEVNKYAILLVFRGLVLWAFELPQVQCDFVFNDWECKSLRERECWVSWKSNWFFDICLRSLMALWNM